MALVASESVHGGIPRVGRLPKQNMQYVQAGYGNIVEVVDASLAPGDSLGHGYIAQSYELMADAGGVLAGLPAARRATAEMPGGATLACMDGRDALCSGGRYALAVSREREPEWSSRLLRHIWLVFLPIQ
jgi:esterase/lipase superfamily enzyme